jgi:hypothetical protein
MEASMKLKLGVLIAAALASGPALAQIYETIEPYPEPMPPGVVILDPDVTGSILSDETNARQPSKTPMQYMVPPYQRGSGQQSGGPARELNPGWMSPGW